MLEAFLSFNTLEQNMYLDDAECSKLWYRLIGPRARYLAVLSFLSSSEVELNPQPIPPGKLKEYEHLVEMLEAAALYRASAGDTQNRADAAQQIAQTLRRTADSIVATEQHQVQARA